MGAYVQRPRSRSVDLSTHRWSPPFISQAQAEQLVATVQESEPHEHGLPGCNWNIKKLRHWVKAVFGYEISRSTLYHVLKQNNLSWKKCQKVLKKADPAKRAAYIEAFDALYAQVCQGEIRLLYLDEAHFHRDMDLGYTWAERGKPAWRQSDCPPLSDRIDWYGVYDFSSDQCHIWNKGGCNGENTAKFLERVAGWLKPATCPTVIIGDGAPCHKAKLVQDAAEAMGFTLVSLPGYSLDLNPIEGLWKWMREDVTQNHCFNTMRELFDACKAFIARINADSLQIISRLWPRFELDPEYEKLLVSI